MLSYRHGFHAGNHGDVLKHICQILVLNKLCEKNKPFVYIDTHSAAGRYDLTSEESQKTSEFKTGVNKVATYQGHSDVIISYKTLISDYLERDQYPGSPEIARAISRENDKLMFMELHNQELVNLKRNMRGNNISIHHRDGFEGLVALTPPQPARGMVLIDPPYEMADEYVTLSKCLKKTLARWQTGIYLIWYPLLSARAGAKSGASERMVKGFSSLPVKNLLNITLSVEGKDEDTGMYGSGMAIINAPRQFDNIMSDTLPELTKLLGVSDKSEYSIEWLVEE